MEKFRPKNIINHQVVNLTYRSLESLDPGPVDVYSRRDFTSSLEC